MNYLDIIIAIPLVWGAYKGFRRGLIFEIAMIIGLLLGFYLAFKFGGMVENIAIKIIDNKSFLPYLSFLLVLVSVIVVMILLAKFFEGILKITNLNSFNKGAGALFGLLKFGLVISILLSVLKPIEMRTGILNAETKKKSLLYEPVEKISQYIFPALGDMQKVFRKTL